MQTLLNQIIKRVMKLVTRKGYLVEEQGITDMAENEADSAMTPLQSAACTYRLALGPRAGQNVLTPQTVPRRAAQQTLQRCANVPGFSLHAEVRCAMNQRKKLEQLCRYITRPAIATERLSINQNGDGVLRLNSPYKEETTHVVMTPLDKIAGSDFEQPKVGPKGTGQDARSHSCNVWPPWCHGPGSTSSDLMKYLLVFHPSGRLRGPNPFHTDLSWRAGAERQTAFLDYSKNPAKRQ